MPDLFQVWIGPEPGINKEILGQGTLEFAEQMARERVLEAKENNISRIASVFAQIEGVVVSGFATPDLKEKLAQYPQITVLE